MELPTEARIELKTGIKWVPTLGDPLTTRFPLISLLDEIAKKIVKTYNPLCGTVNTPFKALYAPPTLEMTCGKMMISPSFQFLSMTVPAVKYTTLLLTNKIESKACIFVHNNSF